MMITLPVKINADTTRRSPVQQKLGEIIFKESVPDMSPVSRQGKVLEASRNKTQLHGAVVPDAFKTERRPNTVLSARQSGNVVDPYIGRVQSKVEHRHVHEEDLPIKYRKVVEKKKVIGGRKDSSEEDYASKQIYTDDLEFLNKLGQSKIRELQPFFKNEGRR